jgi:hypothetical protein
LFDIKGYLHNPDININMKNTVRLFTVDANEGHRGELKLYVNEGIRGDISNILQRLQGGQKPGDYVLDICSLRNIHGEFMILRTSHRDADNNTVRDILNTNSGIIRIRLGEILSFKVFDGPFIRVWITFENDNSNISWGLFKSGKIKPNFSKLLEHSVRTREGKVSQFNTPDQKSHFLKNAGEEWSPSQAFTVVQNNPISVNNFDFNGVDLRLPKKQGRQTPAATRRCKKPDLKKTGTRG